MLNLSPNVPLIRFSYIKKKVQLLLKSKRHVTTAGFRNGLPVVRQTREQFYWYSFSCQKQHQKLLMWKATSTKSVMCLPEHSLSETFIPFFSYFLKIHIYVIFATFNFTKMNQNHLRSQKSLTVRYFWDYKMFSTKIDIYFLQEVVCD